MLVFVSPDDWRSIGRIILVVAVCVGLVIVVAFQLGARAGTLLALAIVLLGGFAVLAGRRRHHAAVLRDAASRYRRDPTDVAPGKPTDD
ncbi:MAG TPA: hypothetical protein VF013_04085 [Candidatus Limnocylindria bacterium]